MPERPPAPDLGEALVAHLPHVVRSAMDGDSHRALVATRRLFAALRDLDPRLVDQLNEATFGATAVTGPRSHSLRGEGMPANTDGETRADLLRVVTDPSGDRPVMPESVASVVDGLIAEQSARDDLRHHGLHPRMTVLLLGPPGVGKTMLAHWIASALGIPLAQVDLAYLVSSYLGQTGQNVRAVLDYARAQRVVLLLDEFDAIAKRRDDATDLGELKRVVSVLLKDLEDWDGPSLLVAASNHPELIDPAVFRRFALVLHLGTLDRHTARRVLVEHLHPDRAGPDVLELVGNLLAGQSGSVIRDVALEARRRIVMQTAESADVALLEVVGHRAKNRAQRRSFCELARRVLPPERTSTAKLGLMLGVAKSTVHEYLHAGGEDAERTEISSPGERAELSNDDPTPKVGRGRRTRSVVGRSSPTADAGT